MDDRRKQFPDLFATLMTMEGQVDLGIQIKDMMSGLFKFNEPLKESFKKKYLHQAEHCHDMGEKLKSAMYRNDRELFDVLENHIMHAIQISKEAIKQYRRL